VPLGSIQAYVNVKAYWEFDGHDRPSGFNLADSVPRAERATKPAVGNDH
jgi:hypothetical protein